MEGLGKNGQTPCGLQSRCRLFTLKTPKEEPAGRDAARGTEVKVDGY